MIQPYQAIVLQPCVREASDPATFKQVVRDNIWRQIVLLRRFKFSYPTVRLVVLSELCTHALEASGSREHQAQLGLAAPTDKPLWEVKGAEEMAMYALAAREFNVYISGSSLLAEPDISAHPFHAGWIIGPDGRFVLKQRMLSPGLNHPCTVGMYSRIANAYGEDGPWSPFPVVDTEIGRLGICVGGDHIQMETCRTLAMRGAEVIIHNAGERNWWMTRARRGYKRLAAFDNQCYLVAANLAQYIHNNYREPAPANNDKAREGFKDAMNWAEFEFMGQSLIVDPRGKVLADIPGSGESATGAVIDVENLRHERAARGRTASGSSAGWSRRWYGEALAREYSAFPGPTIDWEDDGRTMGQRSRVVLNGLLERGILSRSEGYGGEAGGGGFGELPAALKTP